MTRHVRVTLEGVADCDPDGQILRFRPGSDKGPLVLISQAWPGVSVEDVTPPRTWTDGDVVQGAFTWDRRDGGWLCAFQFGEVGRLQDADISSEVDAGKMRVLHYQAGE